MEPCRPKLYSISKFILSLVPTFPMARPLLRLFSQRLARPVPKSSTNLTSSFRPVQNASSKSRLPRYRTYIPGSGPNPSPGQKLKVWPFVAVTLAGTGAYILIVRSRVGTSMVLLQLASCAWSICIKQFSRAALSIIRLSIP